MKERNIQDYLYENPEILFPAGRITEKAREYSIHGKRIDLLFAVDGIRYIVEIKNVPIQREHIGQVIEYYGLMRQYMKDANLSMILVSSSIPAWRAAYLEELGIRCVEIATVPTSKVDVNCISKKTLHRKNIKNKIGPKTILENGKSVLFEEVACPATPKGIAFAEYMRAESLEPIRQVFNEYDILPFGITRPNTLDYDWEYDFSRNHGKEGFSRGGIWWAYRFGFSEEMPKNDVPNISIIANTTGLDIVLNAELHSSQSRLMDRIRSNPAEFNQILSEHGGIWLKTYLKYEHQPRFYHWILADLRSPGEFTGEDILEIRKRHEKEFSEKRKKWLEFIVLENKDLSSRQVSQLESRNKNLNLAIRLVETFKKEAAFWTLKPEDQANEIACAVHRMKSLIDFFVK